MVYNAWRSIRSSPAETIKCFVGWVNSSETFACLSESVLIDTMSPSGITARDRRESG
jgi:hypothetical protein